MSGYQPMERVRTYLEMTSPDQLRPSAQEADISFAEGPPGDAEIRHIMAEVGRPYGWPSAFFDEAEWGRYFAADRRYWLIQDAGTTIGVLALQVVGDDVEIDTFGLLPEAVGTGRGGAALTAVLRHAWGIVRGVRRVWLHTDTRDNPNALRNYLARGLVPYRTKTVGN